MKYKRFFKEKIDPVLLSDGSLKGKKCAKKRRFRRVCQNYFNHALKRKMVGYILVMRRTVKLFNVHIL